MSNTFKILLYYKYVPLENPEDLMVAQKKLCQDLDLKGRILISDEGINGTLAGLPDAVDAYMAKTNQIPVLEDMEWKISTAQEQVFPKLRIRVRPEIVTLGLRAKGDDVALAQKADYIEPEQLQELYDSGEDFIILDARNTYEAKVGKFAKAVVPPIDNFREFPEFVKSLAGAKNKQIVTYCTGGVRCEKASAYLREQGFNKVRQLHGGVHDYAEKTGGKHFEGELFVFDKRLHVPVNEVNPKVIAECSYCGQKVTRYVDCSVKSCPSLFVCCEACQTQHSGACGPLCQEQVEGSFTAHSKT